MDSMNFQFRCSNVTAAQTFTVVSLRRALLLGVSSDESDHLWLWARIDNGKKDTFAVWLADTASKWRFAGCTSEIEWY